MKRRGPTPICPSCGSAAVDVGENGHACRSCGMRGSLAEFTAHVSLGATRLRDTGSSNDWTSKTHSCLGSGEQVGRTPTLDQLDRAPS